MIRKLLTMLGLVFVLFLMAMLYGEHVRIKELCEREGYHEVFYLDKPMCGHRDLIPVPEE